MSVALFGIENDGLNLAVNLLVFFLVVIWLALVYWTYSDARRRVDDPMLVGCATAGALFPFIGTIVYAIVRPPEYLEDAHERELEVKAAETRLKMLESRTCASCGNAVEPSFLRCPSCKRRLREPCRSCGKPLDPRWKMCPYCETDVPEPERERRRGRREREAPPRTAAAERGKPPERSKASERATHAPTPAPADPSAWTAR
jgi:Double zinc ribbon